MQEKVEDNQEKVEDKQEKVEDKQEKVEDEQERVEEEPKGEKEKEPEEVNKKEEETASTELLLVPLLATKEDIPFTLLTQLAEYVKVRPAKCNKRLSRSVPNLNN